MYLGGHQYQLIREIDSTYNIDCEPCTYGYIGGQRIRKANRYSLVVGLLR